MLWEDFVRKSQCSIEVPEHEGSRAVDVTQKDRCVSAPGPCHSFQGREHPLPGGHFWTELGARQWDSFRQERKWRLPDSTGVQGFQAKRSEKLLQGVRLELHPPYVCDLEIVYVATRNVLLC